MATAAAIAVLRAVALANVVAAGCGDKDGCCNGRGEKSGGGCGEGNGVGDNGGNCGSNCDGNGSSAFDVNGGVCGIDNAAMKSMKTTTAT